MNPTLRKLCQCLKDERQDIRQAAAVLIGEVGTNDRAVMRAVLDGLAKGDDLLRMRLLSSVKKIPSITYLPYLITLLGEGGAVREQAKQAIVAIGPRIFPFLRKRYRDASESQKRSIISIFAELGNKEALTFLVDCLPESSFEFLKFICFTLKTYLGTYDKQKKNLLCRKVLSLMNVSLLKQCPNAFISCLIILGMVGDTRVSTKLLFYARPKFHTRVRSYALRSLSQLQFTENGNNTVVRKLLPYLKENDFQFIVRNTLDVLSRVRIPKQFSPSIESLVKSPHVSVREFALSHLGEFGTRASIPTLLNHFQSSDSKLREAARVSLERMPSAVPVILKRIGEAKSLGEVHGLILLLRGHRGYFKVPQSKKLFLRYEKFTEKQDERSQIYLMLLRLVNPDILYKQTMSKVKSSKRRRRFAAARKFLANLQGSPLFNQEARMEMALLELKLSKKDLGFHGRDSDPAVRLLTGLVRGSESFVLSQIKKDSSVDVEDLYYTGFHFSEKLFELKDFGIQVLKLIIRKYPRSKYASLARKKIGNITSTASPAFR